jgi:rod shape-determining protein MreC
MRELFERLRVPLLLVVLATLSLVVVASDRRAMTSGSHEHGFLPGVLIEIAAPVQKLLSLPAELTRSGWGRYIARRVCAPRMSVARVAALERESPVPRGAGRGGRGASPGCVGFEAPMRPAQVVGQDVSPWFRSVLVDRGGSDGVRSGMPVITEMGVVGLVTASSPHAGRTMLLLDAQSAVDALVQRSRARGIVRGDGTDRLSFEFFVRGDDVQVGDVVITSGFGGVYPKGLRIGRWSKCGRGGERCCSALCDRPSISAVSNKCSWCSGAIRPSTCSTKAGGHANPAKPFPGAPGSESGATRSCSPRWGCGW